MTAFIVRHQLAILNITRTIGTAMGAALLTVGVLGLTGHLGYHGPASCTFDGAGTIQSGEMIAPDGQTLACLDGQLIRITFPGSHQ